MKKRKTKLELRQLDEYKQFVSETESLRPNFGSRSDSKVILKAKPLMDLKPPIGRSFQVIKTSPTALFGSTAKKESYVYTGNAMKGIGTMHKSNMVPIFSSEEAVDIAKMRRN